ncbi:MAG: hypothetical protein WKF37_25280 [Bryobacteraceae bacterium]
MISLSPVVVQDMSLAALLGWMLGLTGKDVERIQGLLRRGTFVGGASRFRWDPMEVTTDQLEQLLSAFPDPDASRPFLPLSCSHAVLNARHSRIEVSRESGLRRRFLQRQSFWDVLLAVAEGPEYETYSYKEEADVYRVKLDAGAVSILRAAASLLTYSTLERRISEATLDTIQLFVKR